MTFRELCERFPNLLLIEESGSEEHFWLAVQAARYEDHRPSRIADLPVYMTATGRLCVQQHAGGRLVKTIYRVQSEDLPWLRRRLGNHEQRPSEAPA